MADILPIRRKTPRNQSINQSSIGHTLMYVPKAATFPVWRTLEKTCNLREHPSDRIKGKITDINVEKREFLNLQIVVIQRI